MSDHHHDHGGSRGNGPDHHQAPDDVQAQILDLDAQVMAEHTAAITAWLPVRAAPTEIVDLGAGTGAGSFALLNQFPDAHLTAVDSSAAHLEQLRSRAHAAGLSDRVRIVRADLDSAAWPDLGRPELVWAAGSMHHLTDPVRALRQVRGILPDDGLLAVVELAGLPRFLPPDAPEETPGLEDRCHAPSDKVHAAQLPHRGADWGPILTAAGFTVQDSRTIEVHIPSSDDNAVGAYALATLQRIRGSAEGSLSPEDGAALDRLLDTAGPHSILRRNDLAVRTTRTVWVARRTGEVSTVPDPSLTTTPS